MLIRAAGVPGAWTCFHSLHYGRNRFPVIAGAYGQIPVFSELYQVHTRHSGLGNSESNLLRPDTPPSVGVTDARNMTYRRENCPLLEGPLTRGGQCLGSICAGQTTVIERPVKYPSPAHVTGDGTGILTGKNKIQPKFTTELFISLYGPCDKRHNPLP